VSLRGAVCEVIAFFQARRCKADSKQRAFCEQTIDGLPIDGMDKNGSLSQKVFQHQARLHLPTLQPLLEKRLDEAFTSEIDGQVEKDGK
jgi:hypothetical protein